MINLHKLYFTSKTYSLNSKIFKFFLPLFNDLPPKKHVLMFLFEHLLIVLQDLTSSGFPLFL